MFLYFLACLRPSGQNLQIPVCNWSTTRLYDVTHLLLRQGGGGLGDRCVGREGLASGTWRGAEEESGQTELEAELGRGEVSLGPLARTALDSRVGGQAGG